MLSLAFRRTLPSKTATSALRSSASLPRKMHHMCPPQRHVPSELPPPTRPLSTSATLGAPAPPSPAENRQKAPPAVPNRRFESDDPQAATVLTFFEKATCTWQYIVYDPESLEGVIIDSVLDYDPASGKVTTKTADGLLSFIEENGLKIKKILETHAHADHLTASQYLKQQLGQGVEIAIGHRITLVQKTFAKVYGFDDPAVFENTFDRYFQDDEVFQLGELECQVIHLPGHTPDHIGYVIGKAVFTGDSIFNPDVGSARADFPGGNVKDLYNSTQRLLAFPEDYRLFVGHDYPDGRETLCSTTVSEQRASNKHVKTGTEESSFIEWRAARDAVLGAPRLLHPSLQVNIRAGKLPPADEGGRIWLKTPVKTELKL